MAPRPPEHPQQLARRLRDGASWLAKTPIRFGAPHHTHAVVLEEGRYRVRRLVLSREKADAFRERSGGRFSPENAEDLSEPTGAVELDCATLEELISTLLSKT